MNKKLRTVIGVTLASCTILASGCSKTTSANNNNCPLEVVSESKGDIKVNGDYLDVFEIKDKKTGVHYYLLDGYRRNAVVPIFDENFNINCNNSNNLKDKEKLDKINKQIKDLENEKKQLENK